MMTVLRRKGILFLAILLSLASDRRRDVRKTPMTGDEQPRPPRKTSARRTRPSPTLRRRSTATTPVKIALVQNSGAGDYFQQWTNGANQQARRHRFRICSVYDAQADNAKQATDMETAIGSGVVGIIVDHGQTDTMCPLINDALDAGIPVVIYDIAVQECAPKPSRPSSLMPASPTSSSRRCLRTSVATMNVGYVNVLGIAPLDRRHVVWEDYVAAARGPRSSSSVSSPMQSQLTTPS